MTPAEINFVTQRIAAIALARGDRTDEEIVQKLHQDVPEANPADVARMVALFRSIQDNVKAEIPAMRKKLGDAAFPDLERWKLEAFIKRILQQHPHVDREALDALIGWTDFYYFLR